MSALPSPATKLIGREHDLAQACALLVRPDVRLLTFVGPAGIGKTRLAIEVASRSAEDFDDGVYFVDLTPVEDPDRLLNAIAGALGIDEGPGQTLEAQLQRYLGPRQVLLVLDNFEQIVSAGGPVAALLASTSALKLIVTSRIPLQVSWEHRFPVKGLALAATAISTHREARPAAVSLFVERAITLLPDFNLTDQNTRVIEEICERLDGLPLAIELAAAQIDVHSPQSILEGLRSSGLDMLAGGSSDTPERHQTLRSAIAWSERLLDPSEREVFIRLAVFAGGFTPEAAEAVCPDRGLDVGRTLASLVRKNLLRFEPEVAETSH